jgi:hypothetical protein
MNEMFRRFFTSFHKGDKNVARMATNKEDKITEGTIAGWERATDVTMDAFKNTGCRMGGTGRKRQSFNISFGTNYAGIMS